MNLFSAFEALSASCCLSLGCIARYAPNSPLCLLGASALPIGTAIESHWLSSCIAICSTIHSKSQEMNL